MPCWSHVAIVTAGLKYAAPGVWQSSCYCSSLVCQPLWGTGSLLLVSSPLLVLDSIITSVSASLYVSLLMLCPSPYNISRISSRQYSSLCDIDGGNIFKMPFLWVGFPCNRFRVYRRNGKNRGSNKIWEYSIIFWSTSFVQVQVRLLLAKTKVPHFWTGHSRLSAL